MVADGHLKRTNTTIQQLLEAHGVDLPDKRYKEHLLSRHQPVMQNPVIPDHPHVQRNFKPRERATDRMRRLAEEAFAEQQEKMAREAKGTSERMSGHGQDAKTADPAYLRYDVQGTTVVVFIGELTAEQQQIFLKELSAERHQVFELTGVQQEYLHASVKLAVETKLHQVLRTMDSTLRVGVPSVLEVYLDSPVVQPCLKDIEKIAQEKANMVLKDLKHLLRGRPITPPYETVFNWQTPPPTSGSTMPPAPPTGPMLPPVGLFPVTPSKSSKAQAMAVPSSPASKDNPYGPSGSQH